ncbi:MAG TPA: sigma-54 dependent transcriptional regulator, partial [Syntrophales bacterium]|nr:sigma-54 dependent transcriptional regulator [Syntrophales bacterium]
AVRGEGYDIRSAHTFSEGLMLASSGSFSVIFLDVLLPDGNGLDRFSEIRGVTSAEIVILTGAGSADGAELAIKSGAWDYIQKPASINLIILTLVRAIQYRGEKLKRKPAVTLKTEGIVGKSERMRTCYDLLSQATSIDVNVLISGETGTGKELFARAIHENSCRSDQNFVVVDCASLKETLSESTLFGHRKGAFTGADQNRDGLIKQADGGTLFLDEIGELPLSLQRQFLRVLQEHRFRPLGANREIGSNFRLIAATNRDLDAMVKERLFREDLLFRICAFTIEIPPLRERPEDIVDIAIYHIEKICRRNGIATKKTSPDFFEALFAYHWPGNVRELVNALERAIAASMSAPTLFRKYLPRHILVDVARTGFGDKLSLDPDAAECFAPTLPTLKEMRNSVVAKAEKEYLRELMVFTEGNIDLACRISDLKR